MKRLLPLLVLLPILVLSEARTDRLVVLLIGPPGSGKTTQAKNISHKYGIPSISVADLLKRSTGWKKAGGDKRLRAQIESGDMLDDNTANEMVRERLMRKDAERGFVLDGYPATAAQANALEVLVKEQKLPAPVVIYLDVSDKVARQRMEHRRRADDDPATIERRIAAYHRDAKFVAERYPAGQLHKIDGSGTPQQVWQEIEAAISSSR